MPAHSATPPPAEPVDAHPLITAVLVLACPLVVVGAVVAEVVAAQFANSTVPDFGEWFPLAWPRPARVAWWVAVSAAAGGFRLGLHRLGMRQRPLVVGMTIAPFAIFAIGVALGADYSTWH